MQAADRRWSRIGLAVAVAMVTGTVLTADSDTDNLSVTATVIANCSIDTTVVAMGNYDPAVANASTPLDGTGAVTITCTKGTSPTIGLDTGSHASGSTRRMTDGSEFLTYELYQNMGRTTVWGNSGGDLYSASAAPNNQARSITVFGRVAAGQDVSVGSYADTVVATVNF
jgi:spore coat protein U-like protein